MREHRFWTKTASRPGEYGAGGRLMGGARITTDMITVTGTENLLMAAVLAWTNGFGKCRGAGSHRFGPICWSKWVRASAASAHRLVIDGVERLHSVAHTVVSDPH